MRRLTYGGSLLAMFIALGAAAAEKTPTIKEIMGKLHKGANPPVALLKKELQSDAPRCRRTSALASGRLASRRCRAGG